MHDIHLNRELLRAVANGALAPRTVLEVGFEHLRAVCPTCAAEWQAFDRERRGELSNSGFPSLPHYLSNPLLEIASVEASAAKDFRTLLSLPEQRQLRRISSSRRRYRSPGLVLLLLGEYRRRLYGEPQAAYHFALLASTVADFLPPQAPSYCLLPLSLAEMANACRVANRMREAAEIFARSRIIAKLAGVTDTAVTARIDHLEASFMLDHRRFREADRLLTRARMLYSLIGAEGEIVRVDLTHSSAYLELGKFRRAASTSRRILSSPLVEGDRRLFFFARINLARALAESEEFTAARALLDEDEGAYRRIYGEALFVNVYPWIRGKMAAAEGDLAAAGDYLRSTRDGFLASGNGFSAALASLDLALAYLRAGLYRSVQQLVGEMLPIFAAQDIHIQGRAALRLFQEAVQRETVTERFVVELLRYLVTQQIEPSIPFVPPAAG
jgi:tetratricopeptide (TPR) repeat protein